MCRICGLRSNVSRLRAPLSSISRSWLRSSTGSRACSARRSTKARSAATTWSRARRPAAGSRPPAGCRLRRPPKGCGSANSWRRCRESPRPCARAKWWVEQAKESSIENLRWLEEHTRYVVDPDSFDHQIEEDWEKRFLRISESGGMFHLSGVLDREGGSALEAAIEALSKSLGETDERTPKQRRADALTEIVCHAMGKGTLPKRHGARPHISVHTTLEALRGELGAHASELANGMPVSSKTVQ
ncbi:MAG: DUF222 domain-containing protein, partial [Chloroflexi bacterium]